MDNYISEYADRLIEICKKERPAIIHAASNFYTGIPSIIAARKLGISSVYEVRGLWEITRMSREPHFAKTDHYKLVSNMEAIAAKAADRIVTLTNALKHELVSRGVDSEKIILAPNSVNLETFKPIARDSKLGSELNIDPSTFVFGFIGSFVDYEGLDDLIDAAAALKARGEKFHCLLVGGGDRHHAIKEKVKQLELSASVTLTGRVPHNEVNKYYSLIDLMVYPRKPLPVCEMVSPLKPFEAMAMEIPCLISSVEAMSEFIKDHHTGFIFEKGNTSDLIEKMHSAIRHPLETKKIGRESRRWVTENRTWKNTLNSITNVYEELLGQPPNHL